MRSITFELGKRFVSMVAPAHAAAWALHMDSEDVAILIFRLKRRSELSALTAFNNVRTKLSELEWRLVSSSAWMDTSGGVPDSAPYMYQLKLRLVDGEWGLSVLPGMQEFMSMQRDLTATQVCLPDIMSVDETSLLALLHSRVDAAGPKSE
jgi:hypothetical protein